MPTKTELNLAILCGIIKDLEPTLSEKRITNAIFSATDPAMLGKLARSIKSNPSVLLDRGAPAMPAHSRLVEELLTRGARNVVRPECALCNEAVLLEYAYGFRRICRACYTANLKDECSRCKRVKNIRSRIEGQPLCPACHVRDPRNHEICSVCKTLSFPQVRPNGRPVCQLCYEPPNHRCTECGEMAAAHTKRPRVLCSECYGTVVLGKPPRKRLHRSHKRVLRQRVCATCGEKRLCTNFLSDEPQCTECAGRQTRPCSSCERDRPVQAIWSIGAVCNGCYDGKAGTCSRCGLEGLTIKFKQDLLCHTCAGKPTQSVCSNCGHLEGLYERGLCARCVLDNKLTSLLIDATGTISAPLLPVKQLLLEHPRSESVLGWLRKSPRAAQLLSAIARGEIELSHPSFDRLGEDRSITFLRSVMMSSGVLPERSRSFSLLLPWLERFLTRCPSSDRSILSAFAQWHVFRRLRDKAHHGDITEGSNRWARARLRAAAAFLKFLSTDGHSLETCNQSLLDRWLADGMTSAYLVRDFVLWAHRRNLMQQFTVPLRKVVNATEPIEQDVRWQIVRRLISDSRIAVDLRVAGALHLLFGQHVSRIVRLTDSHIVEIEGATCVVLGREPVPLPEPFASLITDLVCLRRAQKRARVASGAYLLYPGKNYGQPTTSDILTERLQSIGISARAGRNAALMELAARLPAAILRDLIGVHINVAVEWNRNAGHNYAEYVGRLKRQRDGQRKPRRSLIA